MLGVQCLGGHFLGPGWRLAGVTQPGLELEITAWRLGRNRSHPGVGWFAKTALRAVAEIGDMRVHVTRATDYA
jgi:hypothetical protein